MGRRYFGGAILWGMLFSAAIRGESAAIRCPSDAARSAACHSYCSSCPNGDPASHGAGTDAALEAMEDLLTFADDSSGPSSCLLQNLGNVDAMSTLIQKCRDGLSTCDRVTAANFANAICTAAVCLPRATRAALVKPLNLTCGLGQIAAEIAQCSPLKGICQQDLANQGSRADEGETCCSCSKDLIVESSSLPLGSTQSSHTRARSGRECSRRNGSRVSVACPSGSHSTADGKPLASCSWSVHDCHFDASWDSATMGYCAAPDLTIAEAKMLARAPAPACPESCVVGAMRCGDPEGLHGSAVYQCAPAPAATSSGALCNYWVPLAASDCAATGKLCVTRSASQAPYYRASCESAAEYLSSSTISGEEEPPGVCRCLCTDGSMAKGPGMSQGDCDSHRGEPCLGSGGAPGSTATSCTFTSEVTLHTDPSIMQSLVNSFRSGANIYRTRKVSAACRAGIGFAP